MKTLTIVLALLIGVLPVSVSADTCQSNTNSGNTVNQGSVTATNLNPVFTDTGTQTGTNFSFGSGEDALNPFNFLIHTNLQLQGTIVNQGVSSTGYALTPIYGFYIQCAPYNVSLVGGTNYPYTAETNGIAGGTVTVHEYKLTGAIVTVGTVVLPTSAHGGPYINSAFSRLSSPYTPTAGSTFDAQITSYNVTPSNDYSLCSVTALLQ